jgi:plastocyanin
MIMDFAFSGPASVDPGATVTVTNHDSETHSLTADGAGGFDVDVAPGSSKTFTAPTKAGSYAYHCNFHSNMHGTLTVK